MRSDIKREISNLKESIIFHIDFYLKCFDKEEDIYTEDDNELLSFGISTLKDVKQLANGHQRFLKGLLKLQPKENKRRVEAISIRNAIVGNFDEQKKGEIKEK